MRICLQRVARASVTVESETPGVAGGEMIGTVGGGFVALVGVTHGDTSNDAEALAAKVAGLRVFPDDEGKMNLSLRDVGGEVLAVSQFTLHADCRKGRRPSFIAAAQPELALQLYERFVTALRSRGIPVVTGVFGAHMKVELVNDGPVTILLDARNGAIQ